MLTSCNKEVVSIKGKLNGFNNSKVVLILKSKNEKEKILASDISLNDDIMKLDLENVKPPCHITVRGDNKEFSFWIFRYGNVNFEVNADMQSQLKVNSTLENTEYNRICRNYHKMYFNQISEKEEWISKNEVMESLPVEDEERLFQYRKDIKKAYKLRKKSILSTFRKNPQNRIAMALLFDEFERLTSWQKEECLKTAQKYYSDCGINWQLRN